VVVGRKRLLPHRILCGLLLSLERQLDRRESENEQREREEGSRGCIVWRDDKSLGHCLCLPGILLASLSERGGEDKMRRDIPCVQPTTPKAYSKTAFAEGSSLWNYSSSASNPSHLSFESSYLVGNVSLFLSAFIRQNLAGRGRTYVNKDIPRVRSCNQRFWDSGINTSNP